MAEFTLHFPLALLPVDEGEVVEEVVEEMCSRHMLTWREGKDGDIIFSGSRIGITDFLEEF